MRLLRRVGHIIRQRRHDADLAEEIAFHRGMKQREIEATGVDSVEASLAARRALGSVALAQDQTHDVWVPHWLQGIGQDLRLAVRSLRATRIVSTIAVLSLGLGIGANTAIFSLVNSLVLRTLPVVEPQRLVAISSGTTVDQFGSQQWSHATWEALRRRIGLFDGGFAWGGSQFNLSQSGETQPVAGFVASGDFFATLGVSALLGRTFTAADDVRGGGPGGPVAVISYRFWQRRYAGSAGVIGTLLIIGTTPFTIVGVTPPEFFGVEVGQAFDIAVPILARIPAGAKDPIIDSRSTQGQRIVLRLRPGQSIEAATRTLRGLQPQIRDDAMPEDFPQLKDSFMKEPFVLVSAAAGTSALRLRYQRPLLTILVVVALVLLVACANIANLLLARATARRHELSVRVALGASRWRLARQLLIESLVLSSVGAGVGLLFARWSSRLLVTQLSTSVSQVSLDLSLDWRVLSFTAAMTIATALLFGTLPALRAAAAAPIDALKEHGRGATGDVGISLSGSLIAAQVALSLMLLVAAGLFVRSFERIANRQLGFDKDRVLIVTVDARRAAVDPAHRTPFYQRLVDAVSAVPGVASATGSITTPVSGSRMRMIVDVPGAPEMSERGRSAAYNFVTPGWFATYGTPLLAGRNMTDHDTKGAPPVILVNAMFARRFFPNNQALGRTAAVALGRHGELHLGSRTIVGVVGDAVHQSPRDEVEPTMYIPMPQYDVPIPMISTVWISTRAAAGSPAALAPSIAAALAAADKNLAFSFRPLEDQVDASFAQERLVAMLSAFFGVLALLLAALGLYGVTAYAVSRRRMEIGIRMALGAAPGSVVRLVLSRVATLMAVGIIAGAGLSVWASKFVAALLYGLDPRDPATLAGAALVLVAVATLAAWLPARRASRIDPAVALRYE